MTRDQFKALLDPLVLALRADFDLPTWHVYFRALEDVPVPLLASAVERAAKTATFMPKPGELRTMAEQGRQALLAAHPYDGCCDCEDSRGWRTVTHPDGAKVERCACWSRHLQKIAALGVGSEPLALPEARYWSEVGS